MKLWIVLGEGSCAFVIQPYQKQYIVWIEQKQVYFIKPAVCLLFILSGLKRTDSDHTHNSVQTVSTKQQTNNILSNIQTALWETLGLKYLTTGLVIKMKKAKQRFPFELSPCAIQPQKAFRVSSPNERDISHAYHGCSLEISVRENGFDKEIS